MRAWLKVVFQFLIVVALAVAALPLWLGPVLRIAGRPLHLRFGAYRRVGYARFELRDAVFERGTVKVTVRRAQADTPVLWLWKHWRGHDAQVQAYDWHVLVSRSHTPHSTAPIGLAILHDRLVKLAARLQRWLPDAQVENGRVDWPTGGFALAKADWKAGTLKAAGLKWAAGSANVTAVFPGKGPVRVDAVEPDRDWRTQLEWTGPTAGGRAWAWNQPLTIAAQYGRTGWLPVHAEVHAAHWSVATPQARIGAWYPAVSGNCDVLWDHGRFTVNLRARAKPRTDRQPPLDVELAADGDRKGWGVNVLQVSAPFAQVHLNHPVQFRYGGLPNVAGAELTFALDLGGIGGLDATGRISGSARLSSAGRGLPTALVTVQGSQAGWRRLPPGDFQASARVDFARRLIADAALRGDWSGPALARVLPAGIAAERVEVSATASGPWNAVAHRGTAHVAGAHFKPLLPGDLDLAWTGTNANLSQFTLQGKVGSTRIDAGGSANPRGLNLTTFTFAPGGTPALHLAAPAAVTWAGGFRLPQVDLTGNGAEIAAVPSASGLSLRITRVPAAWVSAVLPWTGPNFIVQSAGFEGHWQEGRLVFTAQAEADVWVADGMAQVSLAVNDDRRALHIRQARIDSGGATLASIAGELPAWWQETPPHLGFDPDGPIRLRADTGADSPFWDALADSFGLTLSQPHASLTASGTLRQPVGRFHLQIGTLAAKPGRAPGKVPELHDLTVDAHADRTSVVLDRLSGSIAGRTVLASGRMPMTGTQWTGLFSHQSERPWAKADATLTIGDAGMEAMLPYLPAILAPRGHWSAQFHYADGSLEGGIHLRGLQLKPIASLGLVQNITGDLACHGRAVDVTALTAEVGGQTVRVTGRIDLPAKGPPQYVFGLQGSALPLVRQADLLVRADLDLKASTVGAETRVTGTVRIVDGLMLGDLEDLLPSGIVGGGRPPPYFSVTAEPFARWHAQVALVADHTLRVHTTLFTGDASAQFEILGPLSDPRAVGNLTVNDGQILLPFANFSVQVGAVRLEPDDPYHPRIDIVATARRYDYDLRLNATGDADAPVLAFSSNPALPSDQILQLVMTGQMPQTGSLISGNQAQVAGLGEYLGQGLLAGLSTGGGGNRLSIESGQELSISGKPTYDIEYRLGKRWWITGAYDVFDDYNAGVKWRVYSKGGKP